MCRKKLRTTPVNSWLEVSGSAKHPPELYKPLEPHNVKVVVGHEIKDRGGDPQHMHGAATQLVAERQRGGREYHRKHDQSQLDDTHDKIDLRQLAGECLSEAQTLAERRESGAPLQ